MNVKDLYSAEDFNILLTELGKELQYHSTLSKRFSFCIVGGGDLTFTTCLAVPKLFWEGLPD